MSEPDENTRRRGMNEQIITEFRANAGRVGGMFEAMELLLLHHVGVKSGTAYISPLTFLRDGSGYVVTAANGGRGNHPSWYHNVVAHPLTRVEVGADSVDVRVREAADAERDALLQRFRTETEFFSGFEKATERRIPILVLEPASAL